MTLPSDSSADAHPSADAQALEPAEAQRLYGGRYAEQQHPIDGSDFATKVMAILRLLNKRKALIFAVSAAVFSLGTVRTLMTAPLYTSTIRLQIDRNVAKIIEGGNVTPVEGTDSEFLRNSIRASSQPKFGGKSRADGAPC